MILDEAQAIKSSSSTRWKTLLGFHCRNRLLLTGTPIQNSMQGANSSSSILSTQMLIHHPLNAFRRALGAAPLHHAESLRLARRVQRVVLARH